MRYFCSINIKKPAMKRKIIMILSSFIICVITVSTVSAQEKKSEQKIKIIVSDDSGTKVVIDTLIKDGKMNDSIKLKDGKVIYFGKPEGLAHVKHQNSPDNVWVTVSDNDKESGKETKSMTIIASDSAIITNSDEGGKVMIISSNGDSGESGNVQYRVISSDSKINGAKGEKHIYINDGKSADKHIVKSFDVRSESDENYSDEYSTRSIVAKDGIVVTVEGNDEAKVKELVKEIRQKMGVNPPASEKKDTKKTQKK